MVVSAAAQNNLLCKPEFSIALHLQIMLDVVTINTGRSLKYYYGRSYCTSPITYIQILMMCMRVKYQHFLVHFWLRIFKIGVYNENIALWHVVKIIQMLHYSSWLTAIFSTSIRYTAVQTSQFYQSYRRRYMYNIVYLASCIIYFGGLFGFFNLPLMHYLLTNAKGNIMG